MDIFIFCLVFSTKLFSKKKHETSFCFTYILCHFIYFLQKLFLPNILLFSQFAIPDYFCFLQYVQTFIVSPIFQDFTLISQLNKTCNFPATCFESEILQLEKNDLWHHYVQFMFLILERNHCRATCFFLFSGFQIQKEARKNI